MDFSNLREAVAQHKLRSTSLLTLLLVVVLSLNFAISSPAAASVLSLPLATPQDVGFSELRLERLHRYCEETVSSSRFSGLTVLLAREGKIFEWRSFGLSSKSQARRMGTNDIFAIASLSKIVTSVAALILVEEGKLTLREPISRYLPAFDKMKVYHRDRKLGEPQLIPAKRAITLHDLLTHTAGFYSATYASEIGAPNDLWNKPQSKTTSLLDWADRFSKLPLIAQPGDAWIYGASTDLVGALIEKVSGQSFEKFLEKRIFEPLRMSDTGFVVPAEKRDRQVWMNRRIENGSLQNVEPRSGSGEMPSGGGGLYSTPGDYVRFAQMLLNGGQLDGARILGSKTVELMTRDHLHGLPKPTKIYPESDGFGYGVEVRKNLALSRWIGTEGTYGWNGATTAYCGIDPKERLIMMIWAQHTPNSEFELCERFNNLVYQAMDLTQ